MTIIILDDVLADERPISQEQRQRRLQWFDETFSGGRPIEHTPTPWHRGDILKRHEESRRGS